VTKICDAIESPGSGPEKDALIAKLLEDLDGFDSVPDELNYIIEGDDEPSQANPNGSQSDQCRLF
jgi:hypothetical protein